MARNTTTRTRGQRGTGQEQRGAKYRCLWCPTQTTHGQAIMSHINLTERKGPNKAAVETWLRQFPPTPAGRALRMGKLRINSGIASQTPQPTRKTRRRTAQPPTPATTSTANDTSLSTVAQGESTQTNYYQLGYNEDAALIESYRQQIAAAEELTARLKPRVEEIQRRMQAASALIGQQSTTPIGSFATVGSTQERDSEVPRVMHA